ncbi:Scr1 family TA system antitoxin-like transcriptional regulator [Kitasatospora sp. NPDC052896]|uniref:helix-turn-helix domain-containing protein n=1 Tax=Kitasatospora sp. NPDC052896 TaxID=3364061 RepID=UPI0037C839E7
MGFKPNELQPERSARDLYGWEIRSRRERANGMSIAALAEIVNFSKAHLARIEAAESLPPEGLSEKLDVAFGTDGIFGRLYPLAKKEPYPDRYRRFLGQAAKAVVHESYVPIVHGWLQTADYARELFRAATPYAEVQEIEERVSARLAQQKRMYGPKPARYWFILDEGALRRAVGGPEVMQVQMSRILAAGELRHVTIQVLPFGSGAHGAMVGSLTLLTSPERSLVAYLEGSSTGQLVERRDEVIALREIYDLLRAEALSPRDSVEKIRAVMEEYERHANRSTHRPVAEE